MSVSLFSGLCVVVAATVLPQLVYDGALGPLLAAVLTGKGTSSSLIGLILAAPWLAIVLTARMVPWLCRAAGPAALMSFASLAGALCLGLFAVGTSALDWLALSTVLGILMAIRWVAGEAWLLLATPAAARGRLIGLQETLVGIAGTAGPLLLVVTGTDGATPFLACAGVLAVAALLPPVAARLVPASPVGQMRREGNGRPNGMIVPVTAAALGGASEVAAHAFLPTVLGTRLQLGLDPLLAAALFSLGGTAIQLPFGWLIDRRGSGRALTGLVVLLGVGGAVFPFVPGGLAILGYTALLGAVCGCFYTLATVLVARSTEAFGLTVGVGIVAAANTAGSVAGPLLMGMMIDAFGARQGLGGALVVLAIAAGLVLVIASALRLNRTIE